MLNKVKDILLEYTEVPEERTNEDSRLIGDLGLTSLDIVNIIVRFEDEFDITVNERSIASLQTVGDVAKKLNELI
jgi:acyl carrier protein